MIVGLKGKQGQGIYVQDGSGENYDDEINSEWGYAEKLNQTAKPVSLYQYQFDKRVEAKNN